MARAGRKQLSVQITEQHFTILEKIKEETNLSNAKLIEMLLDSYVNTSINTNTNTNTPLTEERLKEILQETLSSININTNTNTKPAYNPEPPDIDWDEIEKTAHIPIDNDDYKFEYVKTTDHEGNETEIRVMKSEYLYPQEEETPQPEIDPDSDIEKMLRQFEEDYS
jgi:hypothetical protein